MGFDILLYIDQGVSKRCANATLQSVQDSFSADHYHVHTVSAEDIIKGSCFEQACLLIMPGGRSLPYYQRLGALGNRQIQQFVKGGGCYLGICAGAYYAADQTCFAKGLADLEIIRQGELDFFAGVADGPVFGVEQFNYQDYTGASIVDIHWLDSDETLPVLYFGGPAFMPYSGVEAKVLASYSQLVDKPPAIIGFAAGLGYVYLSGVHVELRSTDMDQQTEPDLCQGLKQQHQQVTRLWDHVVVQIKQTIESKKVVVSAS